MPRRPKLAAAVQQDILDDIRSGRSRPGDPIATEIELMARFGVSRTPIREAMQSLYLLGIVDISPRRGATVRALPIESVLDLALLAGVMDPSQPVADLFEFRDVVEGAIAELAARHATEAQIEGIRDILARNAAAVAAHNGAEGQRIDVLFHAAIAEASGNLVFQAVSRAMSGLLAELRRIIGGIPGAPEASCAEHQQIFEAIARRDGSAARQASHAHIRSTRARYESAPPKRRPDIGRRQIG